MTQRVLLVDDEPVVLDTYRRLLSRKFEVAAVDGSVRALQLLESEGPFAVVVSDQRMPGMSGVEFLARVRDAYPDTVRVMLTGCGGLDAAIQAVNEGNVFRFLTKPCPHDQLVAVLDAALRQHALITAERELLERTLSGSAQVLMEILGLVNPGALGRSNRIRLYVRHMADRLGLSRVWQFELAGMLSQIGCVALSPATLEKAWVGQALSPEEEEIFRSHPSVGSALLANIPRLEPVARMIARQQLGSGETPAGSNTQGDEDPAILLGGEMLRVALAFDSRIAHGLSLEEALGELRWDPARYPARLLGALEDLHLTEGTPVKRIVTVHELQPGMLLDEDVRARNGLLLVTKGQEATVPVILRLRSFAASVGISEPLRVLAPEIGVEGRHVA